MRERGFEIVRDDARKHKDTEIQLPVRSTKHSAGYDFYTNENRTLSPNSSYIFWTDVKAYMLDDEVLKIIIRSSLANKIGLKLQNQVGIIDSDYYNNISNDGNIGICLYNATAEHITIKKGEKIAQGIFSKYLKVDNDNVTEERVGGIGSTTLDTGPK